MRDTSLLQQALGLTPPWTVSRSDFDPEARRLDIQIDFVPGSRFNSLACGTGDCPVHDTKRTSWRHLNFFQHEAYFDKITFPAGIGAAESGERVGGLWDSPHIAD